MQIYKGYEIYNKFIKNIYIFANNITLPLHYITSMFTWGSSDDMKHEIYFRNTTKAIAYFKNSFILMTNLRFKTKLM